MSEYTRKQEIANIVTHAAGILFGLVGGPVLLYSAVKNQTPGIQLTALGIYCFSLLLVFSTSTIYHSITKPKLKKLCETDIEKDALEDHVEGDQFA